MRIAFIVDTFPSISETFILNQITGLIDLGHEITVFTGQKAVKGIMPADIDKYKLMETTFCINEKPENIYARYRSALAFFLKDPGLLSRTFNVFKYGREALSLNVFFKARNFKKRGDFDIVQCHFGPNGNIGALLKEVGLKFKLVTMFHGYDMRRGLDQGKDIYKKLCEYGDCFLSISDYNLKNLIGLGFDRRKIVYHPVGVDIEKINFSYRKISAGKKKKIKIITVARLVKEKGIEYGIRAFSLLNKYFPDYDLAYLIAGDGPLMNELKGIARSLGIEDKIQFTGACSHEEVIEQLEKSDIFLLPSLAEALPVSLLEAQASGLPVVASNVGSVFQAMVDGESGYITKAGDISGIALALKKMILNSEKWHVMSIAGRKFVEDKYDIKKLNKKLESIYQGLLNG